MAFKAISPPTYRKQNDAGRMSMFYGLKESTVEIPGGEMSYAAFGRGTKSLILIPGLNVRDVKGAGASLALMYRCFAKEYRVYIFDRRTAVQEGLTNWDLAEDIYAAMQALQIPQADVVGVSQGGMIAMALTLEHPECIRRLVLGVTASRPNDTLQAAVSKWITAARKGDFITINRDTFTLMYSRKYLNRYKLLMPLLVRLVKPRDFQRFAILASAILDFDCYDRLEEIRCPVLVLGGEQDLITTGAASHEIAEKLRCAIHMYPELGHAAYEEAPDFNRRIYDFLVS